MVVVIIFPVILQTVIKKTKNYNLLHLDLENYSTGPQSGGSH